VSDSASDVLFEPDLSFAAGWFVDDPLAQGALKHASIVVLDMIDEAKLEAEEADPELDDFGPLGIFPTSVRTLLNPQLVEKIKLAAVIVGWKLAQPGISSDTCGSPSSFIRSVSSCSPLRTSVSAKSRASGLGNYSPLVKCLIDQSALHRACFLHLISADHHNLGGNQRCPRRAPRRAISPKRSSTSCSMTRNL
jgi:hypothetical protein